MAAPAEQLANPALRAGDPTQSAARFGLRDLWDLDRAAQIEKTLYGTIADGGLQPENQFCG
jgi:hypothetical protein